MNKIDHSEAIKASSKEPGKVVLAEVNERDKNQGAGAESILSRQIISRQ